MSRFLFFLLSFSLSCWKQSHSADSTDANSSMAPPPHFPPEQTHFECAVNPSQQDGQLAKHDLFSKISAAKRRKMVYNATQADPIMDRCVGAMLGMALGDALGAPLEFISVKAENRFFDLSTYRYRAPHNRFKLKPGQWTDDTSMGLCMADALLETGGFDGVAIRKNFFDWWHHGYNNAFSNDPSRSTSIGLGGNISKSIQSMAREEQQGGIQPHYPGASADAGNGSLMRLAPIPIFFHQQLDQALKYAEASSYTTHPGPIAAEACKLMAFLMVRAIHREGDISCKDFLENNLQDYATTYLTTPTPTQELLLRLIHGAEAPASKEYNWNWKLSPDAFKNALYTALDHRGSHYNGYPVHAGYWGSYSLDGLAIALHACYHSNSMADAITRAINYLGDADTTGAIAGQLAGAFYGFQSTAQSYPKLVEDLSQWDNWSIGLRAVLLAQQGPL